HQQNAVFHVQADQQDDAHAAGYVERNIEKPQSEQPADEGQRLGQKDQQWQHDGLKLNRQHDEHQQDGHNHHNKEAVKRFFLLDVIAAQVPMIPGRKLALLFQVG